MIFSPIEITLKDGRKCVLRSAEKADAQALIDCLKITSAESTYLLREPEEVSLTAAQEEAFIEMNRGAPNRLMLLAFVGGRHAGMASFFPVSQFMRHRHRCSVAIALYREYTSIGIGSAMLKTLLAEAEKCGCEQAELEVVTANEKAIGLYKSVGFELCGTKPSTMKMKDGSYQSEHFMVKKL